MDDTWKTLIGLALRRGLTVFGTWLAAKGVVQGDAGVTSFVGAAMVLIEVVYEGWNRYGMVLVNAQLAKLKGVHPAQIAAAAPPSSAVLKMIAFFAILVLGTLMLAMPAMAQSERINPPPGLKLRPLIPTPMAPAAAPAASSDPLANFMAQLEKITQENIAAVIADINAADADASIVITPAIAASGTQPAIDAVVKDPISHACYPAAVRFLQSIPAVAAPKGKFVGVQLFQAKRDFVAQLQAGLPTYLKLGCAPLLGDEINIALQVFNMIGIKAAPAALTAIMPALAPITLPAMVLAP